MIKAAERIGPVTRSSAVCAAIANGHERAIEEAQREAAEAMREAAAMAVGPTIDQIILSGEIEHMTDTEVGATIQCAIRALKLIPRSPDDSSPSSSPDD